MAGTKRKRGSKKPYRSSKKSRSAAATPMEIDKAVEKALNTRTGGTVGLKRKYFDKTVNVTAVATSVTLYNPSSNAQTLNSVPQGDSSSSRDGDNMVMKSIQVKGYISRNLDQDLPDAPSSIVMELMLVMDLQTNATALTAGDVVDGDAGRLLQSIPNSKRFIILGRKTITLDCPNLATDGTNTFSSGSQLRKFKMFAKLNHKVNFISTTDAVGSILDRSLNVIAVASTATAPNDVGMFYTSRLRFVDVSG